MSRKLLSVAAMLAALLALHPSAAPARTRVMMCAGCGVVIDIDPIYYARDKAPEGAVAGSIVGDKGDGREPAAGRKVHGLIGRDARNSDRGDDERGMRLEIRMDGHGERTIEIADGLRVYRRDRVRVHSDRIEVID